MDALKLCHTFFGFRKRLSMFQTKKKKKKVLEKFLRENIFFCLGNFLKNVQKSGQNGPRGHGWHICGFCQKSQENAKSRSRFSVLYVVLRRSTPVSLFVSDLKEKKKKYFWKSLLGFLFLGHCKIWKFQQIGKFGQNGSKPRFLRFFGFCAKSKKKSKSRKNTLPKIFFQYFFFYFEH